MLLDRERLDARRAALVRGGGDGQGGCRRAVSDPAVDGRVAGAAVPTVERGRSGAAGDDIALEDTVELPDASPSRRLEVRRPQRRNERDLGDECRARAGL